MSCSYYELKSGHGAGCSVDVIQLSNNGCRARQDDTELYSLLCIYVVDFGLAADTLRNCMP